MDLRSIDPFCSKIQSLITFPSRRTGNFRNFHGNWKLSDARLLEWFGRLYLIIVIFGIFQKLLKYYYLVLCIILNNL